MESLRRSKLNIKNERLLILLLLSGLYGCKGSFQPLPPEYELWRKEGATTLEIKKVILECGVSSPRGGVVSEGRSQNEIILSHKCIASAGYIYFDPFKGKLDLNNEYGCRRSHDLPACQPGAEIPTPSVERRLNSRYCRIRTSFHACFKNSMIARTEWCESLEYPYARLGVNWPDRQACLDAEKKIATERCETRNYNKPPPECLP